MTILTVIGLIMIAIALFNLWRMGFFDWLLKRGEYERTEEERLQRLAEEARKEIMEEREGEIQREERKPTKIVIKPSEKNPAAVLAERTDLFGTLEKYDTITRDDFNLSDDWIYAAQLAGWIETTDERGVFKVKRDTIREFKEATPEQNPFEPERVRLPEDLIKQMHEHGAVSVGFIPFKTMGPSLEYVVGYTKQTDTLSNPRTTTKLVTALDEAEEGKTSVMRVGDIHIVAGKKVWKGRTQVIYAEPIHRMNEKAETLVSKILEEFSGVDGKHSFKLAVVKALGEEPSDKLKEKAEREAEEAEALGEELPQVSGIPEPPPEERVEVEGERLEEEETKPYEGFRQDINWLLDRGAVSEESDVMIGDFDEFIRDRIQKTLRTARRRRKKLEEKGYIETVVGRASKIWVTKRGIRAAKE